MDKGQVKNYLTGLQDRICAELAQTDGKGEFARDIWSRAEGGGGVTRTLTDGTVIEKGGVGFSHVFGTQLPPSATARNPQLVGRKWEAMGVSLVIHPDNPYVPTSHANVRFFIAEQDDEAPIWWFGGGFDLTPFYPNDDDIVHWHKTAKAACEPFGPDIYPHYKQWCDEYFFLKHRNETRGVGGLFFDDLNEPDFEQAFALMRSIGDHYLPAYLPIVERRKNTPFGDREKAFQALRRGRYVEFNLVYDRGTLFGLQSGGRTESILMSMPPGAGWQYRYEPDVGSAEACLPQYLQPRDWLS